MFVTTAAVIVTAKAIVAPSAQPAMTSVGQCTPSSRRLSPMTPASSPAPATTSILAIGFRKQSDIDTMFREEFPSWPLDPPEKRVFAGLCEYLFPTAEMSKRERVRAAIDVMRRRRAGVLEIESDKRAARRADNLSRAAVNGA